MPGLTSRTNEMKKSFFALSSTSQKKKRFRYSAQRNRSEADSGVDGATRETCLRHERSSPRNSSGTPIG